MIPGPCYRFLMEIEHLSLHRLDHVGSLPDVVVVIDVLRSFSTAASAFMQGARAIYPVDGPSEGFVLHRQLPEALLVGAQPGGRPVMGFDLPNSPVSMASASGLQSCDLILSTAAGVRGLLRFSAAPTLFACGLVNAQATAQAILELAPRRVALLATGEWVDRDGDEDFACADLITAYLRHQPIKPEMFERRVRHSDFGRRFDGSEPHLPVADLDWCARANVMDFAMLATRDDSLDRRLILRPLR